MLLVDTNVLVDVLQNDPQWADWSIAQLRAQAKRHALAINPLIYAEMSLSFSTLEGEVTVAGPRGPNELNVSVSHADRLTPLR